MRTRFCFLPAVRCDTVISGRAPGGRDISAMIRGMGAEALQPVGEAVRDAGEVRDVEAVELVDEPAVLGVLLCECWNHAYATNTLTGSAVAATNS